MRTTHYLVALFSYSVAVTTGLSAGYLNTCGPAPLRFHSPPVLAKAALPPLPKDKPVADFPIPTANQTTNTTSVTASSESTNATVVSVSSTPQSPAAPEIVTPQMLVDVFQGHRPGQCGSESSVTVPMGFVPPPASVGPSSHATYEVQ
jgi:hypothetical protein